MYLTHISKLNKLGWSGPFVTNGWQEQDLPSIATDIVPPSHYKGYSKEVTTQCNLLRMTVSGSSILRLIRQFKTKLLTVIKSWCKDDTGIRGKYGNIIVFFNIICMTNSSYGYLGSIDTRHHYTHPTLPNIAYTML